MTEPRYIDEKLAKARRMYIENRINQVSGKGVWKGRLYFMVPYTVTLLGICMEVPDFLYNGKKEELEAAGSMDRPFCVMLSEDRDISCTFYCVEESKSYDPDDVYQLFERLYPGIQLSPLDYGRTEGRVYFFCYSNKWNSSLLYHTIFIFHTGKCQIFGHLNGEAGEQDALEHIQKKIIEAIGRGEPYGGDKNKN